MNKTAGQVTEGRSSRNVATRRPRLFGGAVGLTAECLYRFHRTINGSLGPALKNRSLPRGQAVRDRALEISDIAELVTIKGPHRAGPGGGGDLLAPILARFEAEAPGVVLSEAVADFHQASAAVAVAFLQGQHGRLLDELGMGEAKASVLRRVLRLPHWLRP